MSQYDFNSLSNLDFEDLVLDIFEKEWGVSLETFKPGKDQGIDLRYISQKKKKHIIQCKRNNGQSLSDFLRKLERDELPKIKKLSPQEYYIVTSKPLSPQNKDNIYAIFTQFMSTPANVVGRNELNQYITTYHDIERKHFKLWLTSTNILTAVLHAAETNQTQFQVRKIQTQIPKFVQTRAFPRAQKILEDNRYVVISGPPGIGKSTLADAILLQYINLEFQPVVIKNHISEGKKLLQTGKPQIFYFDDFLGETYLGDRAEFFGDKRDTDIIDFVEMVQNAENARFLLTTREHILNTAYEKSERFKLNGTFDKRCVVKLEDFSKEHRAKIVYNHLFFSNLPWEYKETLLDNKVYLKIIKHRNFNPRLVEAVVNGARAREVSVEQFPKYVSDVLEDPARVWEHSFRSQISYSAQNILFVLYSLGGETSVSELKKGWSSFHEKFLERYKMPGTPNAFRNGLKEIHDSFVSADAEWVNFLNPSVRDFLAGELYSETERVCDLILSAKRFRQISALWSLLQSEKVPSNFNPFNEIGISDFREILKGVLRKDWCYEKGNGFGRDRVDVDLDPFDRLRILVEIAAVYEGLVDILDWYADHVCNEINGRRILIQPIEWIEFVKRLREEERIKNKLREDTSQKILSIFYSVIVHEHAYVVRGVLDASARGLELTSGEQSQLSSHLQKFADELVYEEIEDTDDPDELETLKSDLERLKNQHSIDLDDAIEKLDDKLTEMIEEIEKYGVNVEDEEDRFFGKDISDYEVAGMFEGLREDT